MAEILNDGKVLLVSGSAAWWDGTAAQATLQLWQERLVPLLESKLAEQRTPMVRLETQAHKIVAMVSLADLPMRVPVDSYGVPFWRPYEREVLPSRLCALRPRARFADNSPPPPAWPCFGVGWGWWTSGVGVPTLARTCGQLFLGWDGLAISAALGGYQPITWMNSIYDLANLDAGFRFAGDENRWGASADGLPPDLWTAIIPGLSL